MIVVCVSPVGEGRSARAKQNNANNGSFSLIVTWKKKEKQQLLEFRAVGALQAVKDMQIILRVTSMTQTVTSHCYPRPIITSSNSGLQ